MLCHSTFAQQDNRLAAWSKQIIEAKTNQGLYAPLEAIKEFYFKDNRYSEFVDFLMSLNQKKKTLVPFLNYYIAFTRYHHLKYLEEEQLWDEYFAQGNTYRDQITTAAKEAIDTTSATEPLHVYAQLILWQFHKDQQDVFNEPALSELVNSALEYAKEAKNIEPIREVADRLLSYAQKAKAKELYKLYIDKIIASDIEDGKLEGIALGFYKEGSLELAQDIYDVYIDRIAKSTPQEKLKTILADIARLFAYKDEGLYDMFYAEKVFERIEKIGGDAAFSEELMYLRAFNLEKAKEYEKAKDIYIKFVRLNPKSLHSDEADFKVGFIYTYVSRDINSGKSYFEKLAKKEENLSPQRVSSLYQLGLLSQWKGDYAGAKDYYNKLIEVAGGNFEETVILAHTRLKEMEEAKPIEYNLKTFLDVSLKQEYSMLGMSKLELKSLPYKAKKDEDIQITSVAYTPESGCMEVQLQYLWSGHTGTMKLSLQQSSFSTSYVSLGTKEINLVVVSPSGIVERNIDLIDIY